MPDNDVIRLRAHHLLCLQGFQGYGYSKVFIKNLKRIIDRFDNEPELMIEVVTECDDICQKCPFIDNDLCDKKQDSAVRIREMDEKVLERIGKSPGFRGTADELVELVNENFKDFISIQIACSDCEWKKECLFYLSKVHQF